MSIGGQMINYNKYLEVLQRTPAPIMGNQLPDVNIILSDE